MLPSKAQTKTNTALEERSIQIGMFNCDLPIATPVRLKKSYKVRKADKHLLKRTPAPGTQTDLLRQAGAPAYARAVFSDEGKINIQYHDARSRFFPAARALSPCSLA